MIPNDKSISIYNAFYRYVEKGDKSGIMNISKAEIEHTMLQYSADRNTGVYIAMQRRVCELDDQEKYAIKRKDKWKDQGIGIIIGVIITIIGILIKNFMGW